MFDGEGVVNVDKATLRGFKVIFSKRIRTTTKLERRSRIERGHIVVLINQTLSMGSSD